MGEVVVSPRSVQWPKEKRRKGERGTGFSLLHRSCTSWWASPVKTATPCAPSPRQANPCCGLGFGGGTLAPSVWSLRQRRDCAMALHCCSSTAMRSISSLNVGTSPCSIPDVVMAA